uniref:Myeloid derived growth factor n=1 Tax=Zonotrichia albicollis TaxID=44394 RepID=A0A8D2NCQ8_ZONAL
QQHLGFCNTRWMIFMQILPPSVLCLGVVLGDPGAAAAPGGQAWPRRALPALTRLSLPLQQWQMTVGVSEDSALFSCSIWRPQGKSYLFFTQFKAEVKGAKIEHAMAYSQAAAGALNDIPLKQEEFGVTETTVSHREGKFRFELSKLMIVAKSPRDEL